jgi:hypothetical protein
MKTIVFSPVRGVGGFPFTAMALTLGIWGLSGSPAMAQGGGQTGGGRVTSGPVAPLGTSAVGAVNTGDPGGQTSMADYGYGGPAYGVPGVPSAA